MAQLAILTAAQRKSCRWLLAVIGALLTSVTTHATTLAHDVHLLFRLTIRQSHYSTRSGRKPEREKKRVRAAQSFRALNATVVAYSSPGRSVTRSLPVRKAFA